ncbi:hypothetical protein VUR80DRAFT_3504 [Thermomyces stellatus]
MSIINQRILRDIEAVYASRPATIRLAHRALDRATLVVINTAAWLSPVTNRLPNTIRDFVHGIPVVLLKWNARARADCGGKRDPPSLEALRKVVLGLRGTTEGDDCTSCDGGAREAHAEIAYHWYVFAENAAVLQFSLIYFDKVNSVWEAFRARWGRKFIVQGANGNMQSPQGSLTDAISNTARDGVLLAACASERFLSEYRWLAQRDFKRRDLLEELKRRYEAPRVVAAWATMFSGTLLETICGLEV